MIHLLWPTIRPDVMVQTYQVWTSKSDNPGNINTYFAVNNIQDQSAIVEMFKQLNLQHRYEILISGEKSGVVHACNYLTQLPQLDGPDSDVVILASDDMYAPEGWDTWILSAIKQPNVALLINDGYIKQDNVTLPIMTMGCFKILNRIIYHPSYIHSYSDTELFHNLQEMNMLCDRWNDSPIFEHKNWANHKRQFDSVDRAIMNVVNSDSENWGKRKNMILQDRLK